MALSDKKFCRVPLTVEEVMQHLVSDDHLMLQIAARDDDSRHPPILLPHPDLGTCRRLKGLGSGHYKPLNPLKLAGDSAARLGPLEPAAKLESR